MREYADGMNDDGPETMSMPNMTRELHVDNCPGCVARVFNEEAKRKNAKS